MNQYKSEFLTVLEERGFIHDISQPSDALDMLAKNDCITAYIGFDCTASSLHVGSLLPIMMLHWLQQTGHRPVVLMGGGTTRVGDPSGKDESRRILDDETINENLKSLQRIFSRFLTFQDDPTSGYSFDLIRETPSWHYNSLRTIQNRAIMANNAEWLDSLNYIEFLRDVGRYFSVNRMLSFDSVKLRLERKQELSFLEFNYMILQAYDFVQLHERYECVLQMGGSDQWGNILNGIELGRRKMNAKLFALTAPLVTTSSGAKMGKTAAGAVWLDASLTKPYEYWQYWRNTEDADVPRFLKWFTVLPLPEIEKLSTLQGRELNEAKKVLATEATTLVHGRNAAETAARSAETTFKGGGMGEELPTLKVSIGEGILSANTKIGFSSSNSHARQMVKDGAVYLGEMRINDPNYRLRAEDFDAEGRALLRLGSRKRGILILDYANS